MAKKWRLCLFLAVLGISCWLGLTDSLRAQMDEEKEVRKIAEAFCNAILKLDMDAYLKLVDAPWWERKTLDEDRIRVIQDRELLHGLIKQMWTDRIFNPVPPKSMRIGKMLPYKEARKNFTPANQKRYERVIIPTDWVVWIYCVVDELSAEGPPGKLFVGLRNGQWKLIGMDAYTYLNE